MGSIQPNQLLDSVDSNHSTLTTRQLNQQFYYLIVQYQAIKDAKRRLHKKLWI